VAHHVYGALLVGVILAHALGAQDRPDGPDGRVWVSAGLGVGRQELGCGGCTRDHAIGGLSLTRAAGITLPRNTGAAVVVHRFTEVSFDFSQQSQYVMVLGQLSPPHARGVTIGVGLGHGRYWGETGPYEHRGSGLVGGAGIALRAPPGSTLALSINASYIVAFTGTRREEDPSIAVPRRLRPRLAIVTASLSLAGRSSRRS
jgi:hypothetical protein